SVICHSKTCHLTCFHIHTQSDHNPPPQRNTPQHLLSLKYLGNRESVSYCGTAPLADALEGSRIIGGTTAQTGAWPWVVSLQIQSGKILAHICGGSLVKNKWVLTAAHCTKDTRDPLMWRAVIGTNSIKRRHPQSKKIKVKAIIIHPDFNLETYVNDIALFHLRKAVKYNDYIQPICLPFDVFQKLDQNTKCFISGWGRTEEGGNVTDVLQEAKVHYISRKMCDSEQSYGNMIPNTSFCAGDEDGIFDTCRVRPNNFPLKYFLKLERNFNKAFDHFQNLVDTHNYFKCKWT
uniref:Transmembrane serine protease 12 n=1 Tax=Ursus maritimus TaxID=29073 RepID=A0A452TSY2_URSMA